MMRRRPRRRPHPQLHLPPLDGHEAELLIALCERIISAIWRAHGEALIEVKACRLPPEPVRPAFDPQPKNVAHSDDDDIF